LNLNAIALLILNPSGLSLTCELPQLSRQPNGLQVLRKGQQVEIGTCPFGYLISTHKQFVPVDFSASGETQLFTTPCHPASSGLVEPLNSTALDELRRYVDEEQSDWDDRIVAITLAYNETPHTSTGFRPFELVVAESDKKLPLRRELEKRKMSYPTDDSRYRTALHPRVHEISILVKETPVFGFGTLRSHISASKLLMILMRLRRIGTLPFVIPGKSAK
jgi:hypothetical protein